MKITRFGEIIISSLNKKIENSAIYKYCLEHKYLFETDDKPIYFDNTCHQQVDLVYKKAGITTLANKDRVIYSIKVFCLANDKFNVLAGKILESNNIPTKQQILDFYGEPDLICKKYGQIILGIKITDWVSYTKDSCVIRFGFSDNGVVDDITFSIHEFKQFSS